MKDPKVIIEYKDIKNSTGKVLNGNIYLHISKRLNPEEQQRHIRQLTEKLQDKINWAKGFKFNSRMLIKHDQDLLRLADTINKTYYNLPLEGAAFHKQKSTWGTCSLKTRRIYISHCLINAPLEILWYVVTHEICHLAEPNHTEKFWELVGKACPSYKYARKMLKAYGLQLNQ